MPRVEPVSGKKSIVPGSGRGSGTKGGWTHLLASYGQSNIVHNRRPNSFVAFSNSGFGWLYSRHISKGGSQ